MPAWATAQIPGIATALVNAWVKVAGTRAEATLLAEHAPDLADPGITSGVWILAELYPGDPSLARCLAVLEAIAEHGLEATLAFLGATNDRAVTVREWIATPTWSASLAMLEARHETLLSPDVEALLDEQADGDATAPQHLAILRLCQQLPIADVYDLVTDVTDVTDGRARPRRRRARRRGTPAPRAARLTRPGRVTVPWPSRACRAVSACRSARRRRRVGEGGGGPGQPYPTSCLRRPP